MPRQCVNVSIIDDTILEISEDFNATLVIQDPQPPNINFGDLETRVIISDDDGQLIMGISTCDYFNRIFCLSSASQLQSLGLILTTSQFLRQMD